MPFTSHDLQTLRPLVFVVQESKEKINNMRFEANKEQSPVLCTSMLWYVDIILIMNPSEKCIIIKCWSLPPGRSLRIPK